MAILESRTQTGISWVKESLALFRQSPRKWLLLALAYIGFFIMMPSMPGLQVMAFVTILLWPVFIVFAMALYRDADKGQRQTLAEVWAGIKPKVSQLAMIGLLCLVYGTLIGLFMNADWEGLIKVAEQKTAMTETRAALVMQKMLPVILKLSLFLLPLLIATWFSPMLVAFNNYPVLKAVKSSVAGCLQYVVAMTVAWLLLTVGIVSVMLGLGILLGVIGAFIPAVAQIFTPALLFMSLLVATALMLAYQYVSYRDVFRAAPQG